MFGMGDFCRAGLLPRASRPPPARARSGRSCLAIRARARMGALEDKPLRFWRTSRRAPCLLRVGLPHGRKWQKSLVCNKGRRKRTGVWTFPQVRTSKGIQIIIQGGPKGLRRGHKCYRRAIFAMCVPAARPTCCGPATPQPPGRAPCPHAPLGGRAGGARAWLSALRADRAHWKYAPTILVRLSPRALLQPSGRAPREGSIAGALKLRGRGVKRGAALWKPAAAAPRLGEGGRPEAARKAKRGGASWNP